MHLILIRPGEAAAIIGVSTRTLARWADDGLIPAVITPSGHRLYRLADVEALVEQRSA